MYKDFDVSVVRCLLITLMFTYLLITCVYNDQFVAYNLAVVYKIVESIL